MADGSEKSIEHRRRVLEHLSAPQAAPTRDPADPQMKIRLIGEAKRPDPGGKSPRRRRRGRKPDQPRLGDL